VELHTHSILSLLEFGCEAWLREGIGASAAGWDGGVHILYPQQLDNPEMPDVSGSGAFSL
jgi:hypothetical protein